VGSRSTQRAERPREAASIERLRWPLIAACSGLVAYLAAFLFLPLMPDATDETRAPRIVYLMVSLLRPDDLVNRWFEGLSWQSVAERGQVLLYAAGVLGVGMAAGWICLRLLRVDRAVTQLEMVVLSLGVGLNLVSLFTLAMGLAGLLVPGLFAGTGVAICGAAAAIRIRMGCQSGNHPAVGSKAEPLAASSWLDRPQWLWALAPFVVALVLAAMLPPLDFDVREYHLQAPKEFLQAGRVSFLPHNVYANMPLGAEMLALAAMVVSGDWWVGALAGKTVIALFTPLTALTLYAAGRRFATPAAGIVAAIIYVSIPWVASVSTAGLIEGAFAYYLFAAFFAVLLWRQLRMSDSAPVDREDRRTQLGVLLVAGFLAGAAAATKYPAVVYCVLPLTALVAVMSYRLGGRRLGDTSKRVAIFVVAVMVGCGLWYTKNAVLTGNPTYPLLYRVFGGATRTPEKEAQWQRAHSPPNYQPADLATRVWNLTMASELISPLVMPLALLALVPRGLRRLVWLLAGYVAFIFSVWWLMTHRLDRFLVPIWPLAALLAGIGATWTSAAPWRAVLVSFVAIGLWFDFVLIAGGPTGDNRYLMPYAAYQPEYSRNITINQRAKRDERYKTVLLVGGAEPFDAEVPVIYNTVFDDSIFEQLVRGRTPSEVRDALEQRGISHILVSWPEINRYRSPGNYGFTDFVQPEVFDELVAAKVLEPVAPSLYRVMP